MGPLTILGSIQDGLMADYTLLAIKSTLDGFTAMALAASLGVGVILSAATVFGFQGAVKLARDPFRRRAGGVTWETPWVIEMTATEAS